MTELFLLFLAFAIFLYGCFSLLRDSTKKIIKVTAEIKKEKRKGEINYIESNQNGNCA